MKCLRLSGCRERGSKRAHGGFMLGSRSSGLFLFGLTLGSNRYQHGFRHGPRRAHMGFECEYWRGSKERGK